MAWACTAILGPDPGPGRTRSPGTRDALRNTARNGEMLTCSRGFCQKQKTLAVFGINFNFKNLEEKLKAELFFDLLTGVFGLSIS
jgi:hypothetical protein